MACCSTFVSGFAAVVALLAFIFDLVLFFVAKARINSVGSAQIGSAIWLTLAAWVLLFFSGCFYTLGRCCINKRKPRGDWNNKDNNNPESNNTNNYAEQMRLDAVKAEADRKANASKAEVGLPAFYETQPLTGRVDGNSVYLDNYNDNSPPASPTKSHSGRPAVTGAHSGYVQAPSGTRAVDEYYNPTQAANTSTAYPPHPQPQRQGSSHTYASSYNYSTSTSPAPVPAVPTQYMAAASTAAMADPYRTGTPNQQYGHGAAGTTCKAYIKLSFICTLNYIPRSLCCFSASAISHIVLPI